MQEEAKEAVVIVFACRHPKEYSGRIETALKWSLDKNVRPIFIFTGIEPIPPDRITSIFEDGNRVIWENKSTTTEKNVFNTLETINKHWINELERVWISSWYHIPRIKMLLRRAGVNVKRETFVKSYSGIALINVLVESFGQ